MGTNQPPMTGDEFEAQWKEIWENPGAPPKPMVRAKVEPAQETRQMAAAMFEMFTAYVDAGFTEEQALKMIGLMFANADLPPQEES